MGGGGKRTRERALPKIFGPLQKSFWSALSWIFVQEKQSADACKTPFLGGVSFVRFSTPSFFHPLWHPLTRYHGLRCCCPPGKPRIQNNYCPHRNSDRSNSAKGWPSNFKMLLLEFIAFRLALVNCLQEEQHLKITGNDN